MGHTAMVHSDSQTPSAAKSANSGHASSLSRVDSARAEKFYSQWLRPLVAPYLGISWSTRGATTSGSHAELKTDIDLASLVECLRDLPGSIVILQRDVTADELAYLSNNIKSPLIDCSDLYADTDEMAAAVSLLHDVIGVSDLAHELRRMQNKPAKLFSPLPTDIEETETHTPLLNSAIQNVETYAENSQDGWKSAFAKLRNDLASDWQEVPQTAAPAGNNSNTNLIAHAATLVTGALVDTTLDHVRPMIALFNGARFSTRAKLNIFVYHTAMGSASKLDYSDVKMNLGNYDYELVLNTFVASVRRWRDDAHIYLVTNSDSTLFKFSDDKTRVVGLNVTTDQPMYERVNAMYAYVHSEAFDSDTLFLDSDAFLNAPFDTYLEGNYDVAITTREGSGLMPVNEGVIVARCEKKERVQNFFLRYLATYDHLCDDPAIRNYGDVRKWRGGQLSLNAISYDAAPFSPYRQLDLAGTTLRTLPCDPFNYSWEYGQNVDPELLRNKIVIHVKGARKLALDKIGAILESFGAKSPTSASSGYVAPHFALFNKMYSEPPFIDEATRKAFSHHVGASANIANANLTSSGALLADDMFVWFRNLGFLEEENFLRAFAPYLKDPLLRARIWRVYTLCWAAHSCLRVEGDFVDLGCYDGRTVHIMTRYINFNDCQKRYFLYDLFENPTAESKKAKHGPNLFNEVTQLFAQYPKAKVIKGPVPDSFSQGLPERIAFAQIDLNEVEAEINALEAIYDRVTPGGIIVLDDFGFKRYAASQRREEKFFRHRGDIVFESPTGQGIFIKRG